MRFKSFGLHAYKNVLRQNTTRFANQGIKRESPEIPATCNKPGTKLNVGGTSGAESEKSGEGIGESYLVFYDRSYFKDRVVRHLRCLPHSGGSCRIQAGDFAEGMKCLLLLPILSEDSG